MAEYCTIEIHYGTGGHGGPYPNTVEALTAAIRKLRGSHSERRIDIRDGVGGPLLAKVSKRSNGGITIEGMDAMSCLFAMRKASY